MKTNQLIKTVIGYDKIKVIDFVEEIEPYKGEKIFVAKVELYKDEQYRCPKCGQKCIKYDRADNVKRHRSLDWGKQRFYVETINPRCRCPEHGVLKSRIPWAFPDSDYTKAFEVRVAYGAAKLPTNYVSREYRIKWATVGSCVKRVQENIFPVENRFRKLRKIAIDETSYKKGYKYLTTVQDLETGEIIWAFDGYGKEVLTLFFSSLSEEQCKGIEYVVADGARWITSCVEEFCPNAVRCIDPFHVVQWANETLDEVRRRLGNDIKKNDLRC